MGDFVWSSRCSDSLKEAYQLGSDPRCRYCLRPEVNGLDPLQMWLELGIKHLSSTRMSCSAQDAEAVT